MKTIAELQERSKAIRKETLNLGTKNGGYHFGGSFSAVEVLLALFDVHMKESDKFILSKGHACWPLYVILRERGFNPMLSGHPSYDPDNGITATTGSEGHGLPIGIGISMARKFKKQEGSVYVLMGDGECQEGTTWESMLVAAHHKLDNLVAIVDFNRIQGSGFLKDILSMDALGKIAAEIGWSVSRIDGHSYPELLKALEERHENKPRMIVADTVKGKGVSYMEGKPQWHAKFPNPQELEQAYQELT